MWLKVESGDNRGETLEITKRQFLLGRDDDSDFVLTDERASRQHARIETLESGGMVIRDLGATNGTYVNGTRITEPVVLEGGETIRIGRTELSVSRNEPVPLTAFDPGSRLEESAGGGVAAPPAPAPAPAPTPSAIERAELRKSVKRSTIVAAVTGGVAIVLIIALIAVLAFKGDGKDNSTAAIVKDTKGSVVDVITSEGDTELAGGSGWVLDAAKGLIVTNNHVVNTGTRFTVVVDGQRRDARLVSAAPCDDLAVLEVQNTNGLVNLPLSSQSKLEQGDKVVALGFPGNASIASELQATDGIVSAVKTRVDQPIDEAPVYRNMVQTDAAVNHGNSGGPLVNADRELVGVNTYGGGGENQNYAIGVDRVKELLPILSKRQSPGWSGLGFMWLTPEKEAQVRAKLKLPAKLQGILMVNQVPGTPAFNTLQGDPGLLVAIDNAPLDGSLQSYCKAVQGNQSDDTATFTFAFPGQQKLIDVKLAFG